LSPEEILREVLGIEQLRGAAVFPFDDFQFAQEAFDRQEDEIRALSLS
jgi:hypothetical protein